MKDNVRYTIQFERNLIDSLSTVTYAAAQFQTLSKHFNHNNYVFCFYLSKVFIRGPVSQGLSGTLCRAIVCLETLSTWPPEWSPAENVSIFL